MDKQERASGGIHYMLGFFFQPPLPSGLRRSPLSICLTKFNVCNDCVDRESDDLR